MRHDFSLRELSLIRESYADAYSDGGNAIVSMVDLADYDALREKLRVAVEAMDDAKAEISCFADRKVATAVTILEKALATIGKEDGK